MVDPGDDPTGPASHLAALSALPALGPRRATALLGRFAPHEAWAALVRGDAGLAELCGVTPACVAAWRDAARAIDPASLWRAVHAAGIGVVGLGDPAFPAALVDDPEPPFVVFWRGGLAAADGPSVAIVGTRQCTAYGRDVAAELGRELSAAGVSVVSGLATGIDAAAHRGAVAACPGGAPPVAVVATGLDVVYPRANAVLWDEVAACGVVLSEATLGVGPSKWRFPARNRIIAALADVVVVVESHARGGSLHTVDEAVRRGRPVLAVPGPIRSAASAGTNRLLADGCAPVCGVDDVLVALGLAGRAPAAAAPGGRSSADEHAVLEALGWQPATLDDVARRCPIGLGRLAVAVDALVATGRLTRRGGWLERAAR